MMGRLTKKADRMSTMTIVSMMTIVASMMVMIVAGQGDDYTGSGDDDDR